MNEKTTVFLEYRALLFSIAYNMLADTAAAEDLVQETYLKWMGIETEPIRHTKAYLVKIVTNKCINYLDSSRMRKEKYAGIWLPEPLRDYSMDKTHKLTESYHSLSLGIMVLLEKLSPQERAIFILREVFAYDYHELAEIFDKKEDNCRQIFRRAKEHLGKDTVRFQVDIHAHEKMLRTFMKAVEEGDMEHLIGSLKEDVVLMADGGSRSIALGEGQRLTALLKPIQGRDHVSKVIMAIMNKIRSNVPDFNQDLVITNGMPSIICYIGMVPVCLNAFECEEGKIRNIFVQGNPDKLRQFFRNVQ